MKKFIGGYYVENLDMEFKGLAFTEVLVLSLEEALKHSAIENCIQDYFESSKFWDKDLDDFEKEDIWNGYTEDEKIKIVEEYILFDEIFGGRFYNSEEVEKEVEELKENAKLYQD